MNPVYVRALNKIRQSGIDHPADFGRAVDLLDHLLDAREVVTYIDEVHEYLEKQGANPEWRPRGKKSMKFLWKSLGDSFKFDQYLRYKISIMKQLTSQVSDPVELIKYYPTWVESLSDCDVTYTIERKKAEHLRELTATEMAKVLGEETTSYLNFRRLFQDRGAQDKWLDGWRSTAIVGIAGVANSLPREE